MSDWFFMLGEPLDLEAERQVSDYLTGLGLRGDLRIESVADWNAAHAVIAEPRWDQRWWDAEQREQERLSNTREDVGEPELSRSLAASLASADAVYEAASVGAARAGCTDVALIRAASGALSQALYLAELTRLAGAGERHPFSIKKALFAGGHWPLGIVQGTYYVF